MWVILMMLLADWPHHLIYIHGLIENWLLRLGNFFVDLLDGSLLNFGLLLLMRYQSNLWNFIWMMHHLSANHLSRYSEFLSTWFLRSSLCTSISSNFSFTMSEKEIKQQLVSFFSFLFTTMFYEILYFSHFSSVAEKHSCIQHTI